MKDKRIFKSFAALTLDGGAVPAALPPAPADSPPLTGPDAGPREGAANANDIRAMLDARYAAPFAFSVPHRHFGINE